MEDGQKMLLKSSCYLFIFSLFKGVLLIQTWVFHNIIWFVFSRGIIALLWKIWDSSGPSCFNREKQVSVS